MTASTAPGTAPSTPAAEPHGQRRKRGCAQEKGGRFWRRVDFHLYLITAKRVGRKCIFNVRIVLAIDAGAAGIYCPRPIGRRCPGKANPVTRVAREDRVRRENDFDQANTPRQTGIGDRPQVSN